MESEGPYKLVGGVFEGPNGFNFRIVWGPDFRLDDKIICEEIIKIANQAHAEGRKSMDKDLKELLEFSDRMSKWARDLSGKELVYRFQHWKRSHGFVDENSEKEMRELWHILHD